MTGDVIAVLKNVFFGPVNEKLRSNKKGKSNKLHDGVFRPHAQLFSFDNLKIDCVARK